jgi:hypothetical protein
MASGVEGPADLVFVLRRLSAEVALAERECVRLETAIADWAAQRRTGSVKGFSALAPLPPDLQAFDRLSQSLSGLRHILDALADHLPQGTPVPLSAITDGLTLRGQADRLHARDHSHTIRNTAGEAEFF